MNSSSETVEVIPFDKSGSFFSYGEIKLGQGRNNVKQFLRDNPELAKEVEGKIYAELGLSPEGRMLEVPDVEPAVAEVPAEEATAA